MAVLRLLGYLVNAVISWVITIPVSVLFFAGAIATHGALTSGNFMIMRLVSFAAGIVPYLLILFTAERKGLHDMISKTIVASPTLRRVNARTDR